MVIAFVFLSIFSNFSNCVLLLLLSFPQAAGGMKEIFFKTIDDLIVHYKRRNQGLAMHLRHAVKRKTGLFIQPRHVPEPPRPAPEPPAPRSRHRLQLQEDTEDHDYESMSDIVSLCVLRSLLYCRVFNFSFVFPDAPESQYVEVLPPEPRL